VRFFQKQQDGSAPIFFQSFKKKHLLQPALKSNTPGLLSRSTFKDCRDLDSRACLWLVRAWVRFL